MGTRIYYIGDTFLFNNRQNDIIHYLPNLLGNIFGKSLNKELINLDFNTLSYFLVKDE